ncbi:unnamed protein product [Echinostoma caproni]|uniref:HEPN domain-containing protein n=1 Tax=Echinostoma caproni TaxID=27848 RepID=A0A183ATI0_9TREM|nr:unnamed protein product [Echinostoma caproni]
MSCDFVTIIRSALRATYEQTGGGNMALKAALDKTLDEALKVETERRLGLADLDWYERNYVPYPRRWDYHLPYYDRARLAHTLALTHNVYKPWEPKVDDDLSEFAGFVVDQSIEE